MFWGELKHTQCYTNDNHFVTCVYVCVCMYVYMCNAAIPTIYPYLALLPSSKMTTISQMPVPSNVCLPTDEVGHSSAAFASSIVVSIIFSTVTSSLVTVLVMYCLCFKQNRCAYQNDTNRFKEIQPTQQVVVYEEVCATNQPPRISTDSMNTTSNIAYGKI